MAAMQGKEVALPFGLHTFGDNRQPHALGQRHDSFGDGGIVGIGEHVAHEGLIDFQLVQGQELQIGKRGVAGTEVIQRKVYASGIVGNGQIGSAHK